MSEVRDPYGYHCGTCGAEGCKLWRPYQTFIQPDYLRCTNCAETASEGGRSWDGGDSIGWYVPAVQTADASGYWGFSTVPNQAADGWYFLPDRPGEEPPSDIPERVKAAREYVAQLMHREDCRDG